MADRSGFEWVDVIGKTVLPLRAFPEWLKDERRAKELLKLEQSLHRREGWIARASHLQFVLRRPDLRRRRRSADQVRIAANRASPRLPKKAKGEKQATTEWRWRPVPRSRNSRSAMKNTTQASNADADSVRSAPLQAEAAGHAEKQEREPRERKGEGVERQSLQTRVLGIEAPQAPDLLDTRA